MTTTDLIRYDLLTQEALRGVVRKVLADAAKFGLPGEHHFFITFDTNGTGVRLSSRLREQYPEEMTIVIQHQYRDLAVTEHTFEIGLSFGGIPERLLIPFEAITKFVDPAVSFGLQFELLTSGEEVEQDVKPSTEVHSLPSAAAREALDTSPSNKVNGISEEKTTSQVVRLDQFRKK